MDNLKGSIELLGGKKTLIIVMMMLTYKSLLSINLHIFDSKYFFNLFTKSVSF